MLMIQIFSHQQQRCQWDRSYIEYKITKLVQIVGWNKSSTHFDKKTTFFLFRKITNASDLDNVYGENKKKKQNKNTLVPISTIIFVGNPCHGNLFRKSNEKLYKQNKFLISEVHRLFWNSI